jgi:hypothetical protein
VETAKAKLPTLTPDDFVNAITELREIGRHGLKSGLGSIDEMIGGIWRDGVVISGKPGHGKTVFTLNLIWGFIQSLNRVIYLDLENDRRDTIKRMILITLNRIYGENGPTEGELIKHPEVLAHVEFWEKIYKHLQPYFSLINLTADKKISPKIIDGWLKIAAEEIRENGKQAILIIDSINELAAISPLAKGLYESLERWLAEIKLLRVKYQIPIALICHVPKDSPEQIFNPKGSSGIAHFARTQIVIKRPGASSIEANIVRSQFGRTGKARYDFDQMRLGLKEQIGYQ